MDIGTKLKLKRTQLGLTQEQLASKLGVARQTVANWEKSKTYPDIGSLLKLSDLYKVSLDELLKEDAHMKQHIQRTAVFSDKLWKILFVTAVLMLPASILLSHWGWSTGGAVVAFLGMFLLLLILIVRWKLSGGKKSELVIGLFFWSLFAAPHLISLFTRREDIVSGFSYEYLLFGVFLLYSYGTFFQTKLAFLLTILLYFGTPICVTFSTYLPTIADEGITRTTSSSPFGKDYRVDRVVYQADNTTIPSKITLDMDEKSLILDHVTLGTFHQEETEPGSIQEEWTLIPAGDPDGRIRLIASIGANAQYLIYYTDTSTPEHSSYDTLWHLQLEPLENVRFMIESDKTHASWLMIWYPPELLTDSEHFPPIVLQDHSASAAIHWSSMPTLTLVEEYYHNGQMERTEYQLMQNKNGDFPLPDPLSRRYPEGEQYIIYRIPYKGGEYLFRFRYP